MDAQASVPCMHEQIVIADLVSIWLQAALVEKKDSGIMPVSADNPQNRTWIFVINNWTEDDINWVMALEVNKITVSKEIGDEGTPHLQGVVTFKRLYTFNQVKKLHPKAHWEVAVASIDFNYCKKLGGELVRDDKGSNHGKRSDIDDIRAGLDAGDTLKQIVKKARSMQSVSFAKAYIQYTEEHLPRNTKIDVFWYYGCTGLGKTKKVLDQTENLKLFSPISFKWWDGYEGQDAVLLDDLRPDWCKPCELLKLLDNYRFNYRVETKGSSRCLLATKIYVTCPWHPEDFWRDSTEDPKQLLRRITELVHFREDGQWLKPPC